MKDALTSLVEKHRTQGLLIDTNLLLLLVIGLVNQSRIGRNRTSGYSLLDFRVLVALTQEFRRLIITPYIAAETSNLLALDGHDLTSGRRILAQFLIENIERYTPSSNLAGSAIYHAFGLSDASVAEACDTGQFLAVTDDGRLYDWLGRTGADAIYFRHLAASQPILQ